MKKTENNIELFYEAIEKNDYNTISKLIKSDKNIVNVKNNHGKTPLHLVLEKYYTEKSLNIEIVLKLIEKKADVNAKDLFGDTPLHLAAQKGYIEIALRLINEEADVNAVNRVGQTPLHLAIQKSYTEVALRLIEKKADVNAKDFFGDTPLHLSIQKSYTEVALRLIEKKADVNAVGRYDNTPLHLAVEKGYTDIALKLIEKKADVDAIDQFGNTPLHLAIEKGYTDIAIELIKSCADVNAANKGGNTPLLLAAQQERTGIVKAIIESGKCDLSAVDNHGNSIFTYYIGNNDMLELILGSGGNYELYLKAFEAMNGAGALEDLMKSTQGAHTVDVKEIYLQIKDNSSTDTIDEIKAKLEQLINPKDKSFKSPLDTLIDSKKLDAKEDKGLGKKFVEQINEIKSEKEHLEKLKTYLIKCLGEGINILNVGNPVYGIIQRSGRKTTRTKNTRLNRKKTRRNNKRTFDKSCYRIN